MAEVISDQARIASWLDVPETVLAKQDWPRILESLVARLQDSEQCKTSKVLLEIEVERLQKDVEERERSAIEQVKYTKAQSENSAKEARAAQATLQEAQENVTNLEAAVKARDATIKAQKVDIERLGDEKRQALVLVDRQSKSLSNAETSYNLLNARFAELRTSYSKAEEELRAAKLTESAATFKCLSLEQELLLTSKRVESLSEDVETRTKEFSVYRREKSALITSLQSAADAAMDRAVNAERSSAALSERHDVLKAKVEEGLANIRELQEDRAIREEQFRAEVAAQARLSSLWERSAHDAEARAQEIENTTVGHLSDRSSELARLHDELRSANAEVGNLRQTYSSMTEDMERLQAELDLANQRLRHLPSAKTGLGLLSPSADVLHEVSKAGLNLTELYTEYLAAKQHMEHERRRNKQLQSNFDALVAELESRAPQIQAQREEYTQLQREMSSMSEAMRDMAVEKDNIDRQNKSLAKSVRDGEIEAANRSLLVLDLSRQVQKLLFEIEEKGFRTSALTEEELTAINHLLSTQERDSSAVHSLISERLILFNNIVDLQQQNQQLLKVIRQLGTKMEEQEERTRAQLENISTASVAEAQTVIVQLTEKLRSSQMSLDACVQEKDMLRRMVRHDDENPSAIPLQIQERSDESRSMLGDFEVYRLESSTTQKTLTDQLKRMDLERSDLQIQLARAHAQLEFANERHSLVQGTVDMLRKDSQESRDRTQSLQSLIAKQESNSQELHEEINDFKSMVASLRSENLNLGAEKRLWKSIEQRLSSELDERRAENTRLVTVVATLQALQSERERTDADTRAQVNLQQDFLQTQLSRVQAELREEQEAVKRLAAAREISGQDVQEKSDQLQSQLVAMRETMTSTAAEKQALYVRVSELEARLEEERQSAQRFDIASKGETVEHARLPEVSELKASLAIAETTKRQSQEACEHLKGIAAAAEQSLQALSESFEDYKAHISETQQAQEAQVQAAQRTTDDLEQRLAFAQAELGELSSREAEKRSALETELSQAHLRLSSLNDIEEKFNVASACYRDDLRIQAEIAQDAHQNYEHELVKHAEVTQTLRAVRDSHRLVTDEVIALRRTVGSADENLEVERRAWTSQKELYEREVVDLKKRLQDLQTQNQILHEQYQSTSMHQDTQEDLHASSTEHNGVSNNQQVMNYLRREKEIAENKLELLQIETKRSAQQLAKLSKAKDDLEKQLVIERKQNSDIMQSQPDSSKTEISILRESNTTLRAELESSNAQLSSCESRLASVRAQLEPLQERLAIVQAELVSKDAQIEQLEADNGRWKQRTQSILEKYERIDPEELRKLQDQASSSADTIRALSNETATKDAEWAKRIQEISAAAELTRTELAASQEKYSKLSDQARGRISNERKATKAAVAQVEELSQKISTLTDEIVELKSQLESTKVSETRATEDESSAQSRQIIELQEQLKISETKSAELQAQLQALSSSQTKPIDVQSSTEYQMLAAELQSAKSKFTEAAVSHQEELETLRASLRSEAESKALETASQKEASEDVIEKQVQQRLAALLAAQATTEPILSEEDIQTRIDEAVAAERSAARGPVYNETANEANQHDASSERNKDAAEHESSTVDLAAQIETAVAAKEAELKEAFAVEKRDALRNLTKKRVDEIVEARLPKKVEEQRHQWQQKAEIEKQDALKQKEAEIKLILESKEAEFKDKLDKLGESVKKEGEMRVKLQIGSKDRQISSLTSKVAALEKQLAEAVESSDMEDVDEAEAGANNADEPDETAPEGASKKKRRSNKSHRGRSQQQGLKRPREDGSSNGSPAKKAA